jgi:Nuclease-related domain
VGRLDPDPALAGGRHPWHRCRWEVLGNLVAPRLGLVVGALAAMVAGWALRFRPSPDATAWQRGAAGERRTARLLDALERHGWAILHDLAVPGSRASIDHLAIGPGGVFVIDSKQYRGRLQLDPSGRLWHGRYPLVPTLRAVGFEADQAAQVLTDPDVVVVPIVAVHGTQVPWGKVVMDGVPVVPARRRQACFASSRRCWGQSGSPAWPTRRGSASTPPLDPQGECRVRNLECLRRPAGMLDRQGAGVDVLSGVGREPAARCWRSSSKASDSQRTLRLNSQRTLRLSSLGSRQVRE